MPIKVKVIGDLHSVPHYRCGACKKAVQVFIDDHKPRYGNVKCGDITTQKRLRSLSNLWKIGIENRRRVKQMTNERAVEILNLDLDILGQYGGETAEAYKMAIKALEKQQDELVECDRTSEAHPTHGSTYGGVSWGGTYKEEAQPTDASPWGTKLGTWIERTVIHKDEAKEAIEEWQSARCSVCGKYHTTPYMYYFDEFKFCPNCGSYMGGGEDEEA